MMARWRALRRRLVVLQGVEPGVVSYPVEHAGCSVRSVQEAQAVVDCVRELLAVSGFRRLVLRARWRRRIALWWRRITHRLIVRER